MLFHPVLSDGGDGDDMCKTPRTFKNGYQEAIALLGMTTRISSGPNILGAAMVVYVEL